MKSFPLPFAAVMLVTLAPVLPAAAQKPGGVPPLPSPARGSKPRLTPMEMAQRQFMALEKAIGKPLTVAQKTTIIAAYQERMASQKAAADRFNEKTAKALGMSVDTLKQKMKEMRAQNRGSRGSDGPRLEMSPPPPKR